MRKDLCHCPTGMGLGLVCDNAGRPHRSTWAKGQEARQAGESRHLGQNTHSEEKRQ